MWRLYLWIEASSQSRGVNNKVDTTMEQDMDNLDMENINEVDNEVNEVEEIALKGADVGKNLDATQLYLGEIDAHILLPRKRLLRAKSVKR